MPLPAIRTEKIHRKKREEEEGESKKNRKRRQASKKRKEKKSQQEKKTTIRKSRRKGLKVFMLPATKGDQLSLELYVSNRLYKSNLFSIAALKVRQACLGRLGFVILRNRRCFARLTSLVPRTPSRLRHIPELATNRERRKS